MMMMMMMMMMMYFALRSFRINSDCFHFLQVKLVLFFTTKEGAAQFIASSESLLYAAMELNRYRQIVYLPDAQPAQDTSVIKSRYLEMAAMVNVPLKLLSEDSAHQCLDYTASFEQKQLCLRPVLSKISISQPSHHHFLIVVPLKGKAVVFSDEVNTDLLLTHNDKAMILRFSNDVDRDAFAYMCVPACLFSTILCVLTSLFAGFCAIPKQLSNQSSALPALFPTCSSQRSCRLNHTQVLTPRLPNAMLPRRALSRRRLSWKRALRT